MKRFLIAAVACLGLFALTGAASAGSVSTPSAMGIDSVTSGDKGMTLVRRHGGGGGAKFYGGGGPRLHGGYYRGRGYRRGGFFYGAPFIAAPFLYDDYYVGSYGYGYGGSCYARCRQFRGPRFCRYNAGYYC